MADNYEKTAIAVVIAVVASMLVMLGVGLWCIIQFVQWVTSK